MKIIEFEETKKMSSPPATPSALPLAAAADPRPWGSPMAAFQFCPIFRGDDPKLSISRVEREPG
jgi:hypothetical protein